jgi:hypothetical protein
MDKPTGTFRCRRCRRDWDGSELLRDPRRMGVVWTCGNQACAGNVDYLHYPDVSKTTRVPREIVNNQLLVALDDKDKVAVVIDEDDLQEVIDGLTNQPGRKARELRDDMVRLRDVAFRPTT